jgi:cytochrome P450
MDIVKEMGELHMRIILVSAFGLTNLNKLRLPYEQRGVTKMLSLDQYLRKLTSFMIFRTGRKIFALIPYLMFFFYNSEDREYKRNIQRVRDFCESIVEERKKQIAENKEKYANNTDLLAILLNDELFKDNNKAMIDEIITFFLAGSFTLRSTNSNMFMYLAMYPEVRSKLMKEIVETHLKDHIKDGQPIDT